MKKFGLILLIGLMSLLSSCAPAAKEAQPTVPPPAAIPTTIPTETVERIPLETFLYTPTKLIINTLRPSSTPIPTNTKVAIIPSFTPAPPTVYVTESEDSPTEKVSLTTTPTSVEATLTKTPVITYRCGMTPNNVPGGNDWDVLFWVQFYPQQSGLEF